MQRTIKTKIGKSKALSDTISHYNLIVNLHISKSLELQTISKKKLHNACYSEIRDNYPNVPSALVQCSRDHAVEMLKSNKYKRHTYKKYYSNIRYDKRTLRVNWHGDISISTVRGRKKMKVKIPGYFKRKYGSGNIKSATLGYENNKLFIFLCVDIPKPHKRKIQNCLGLDLGIKNIYTASDGHITKSSDLNRVRRKHNYLRKQLQSKGTRSAKRKIKELSGRERRFIQDWIHNETKRIVNKPYDLFVLENLKNLRKGNKGKVFNRRRSQFPFFKFRQILEYKLEHEGKTMVLINPHYTSQKCSCCGHTEKANRHKGWFVCRNCGYQDNADLNASNNISQIGLSLFEQGAVNHPDVALDEAKGSTQSNCGRQQLQTPPLGVG